MIQCIKCLTVLTADNRGSKSLCSDCLRALNEQLTTRAVSTITVVVRCCCCQTEMNRYQADSALDEGSETTTICTECAVRHYPEEAPKFMRLKIVALLEQLCRSRSGIPRPAIFLC